MKFGKRLQRLLDDSLPEWRDKFIAYKRLKKSLKLIFPDHEYAADFGTTGINTKFQHDHGVDVQHDILNVQSSSTRSKFMALLNAEIDKMNTFFLEKEEEFVIRLQEVKGKLEKQILVHHQASAAAAAAASDARKTVLDKNIDVNVRVVNAQMQQQQQQQQQMMIMRMMSDREIVDLRKAIVNIHGEMVLLENYSALNYTGLVKIIKKHDKITGMMLRMPFIQSVLQEPFFATDIIAKLVHDCEETLQRLNFPLHSTTNRTTAQYNSEHHHQYSANNINAASATAPAANSSTISISMSSSNAPMNNYANAGEYNLYQENVMSIINGVGVDDDVDRICRNIVAAWRTMKEFRKGSSTYNFFSIPPFGYDMDNDGQQLIMDQSHQLDQQLSDHSTATAGGSPCKPVAALVF